MNKILTIFRREYLNIVTKKSFLIATFLVPLGIIAIYAVMIAMFALVEKGQYTVLIPNEKASIFAEEQYQFSNTSDLKFAFSDRPFDELKDLAGRSSDTIVINPPQRNAIENYSNGTLAIFSKKTLDDGAKRTIKKQTEKRIKQFRIEKEGMTEEQLNKIEFKLQIDNDKVNETGETEKGFKYLNKGLVYFIGVLMYFLLAIYGNMLMQGVIEEKANKIVEVIVSSVKPFQLLIGKVTALTSVALTQMIIWGILIMVGFLIAIPFLPEQPEQAQSMAEAQAQLQQSGMEDVMYEVMDEFQRFNWSILWLVPIFFIGGFLIYGSLYAAVGSTVDNVQDAQQFVLPVTLPLIFAFYAVFNIAQNPESKLAIFTSHFPFTSMLGMPARMAATSVPWWEVLISIALLILGFLGVIWMAGKIYRTGILMYGKKPSFKELFKWIRA
jgi:ABC-2 type transport system permease protein